MDIRGQTTNILPAGLYSWSVPELADWGLHHFHLGADLANTGKRVMRTRRVLIAHLTEYDAFLLDVTPHGKGFSDIWGQKRYLEILYRNWPEVLEKFQLKGVLGLSKEEPIRSEDYVLLRQSGVTVPIEIDGKVFLGPGLGIATDRSSTKAVQRAGDIQYELAEGEKLFRKQHPDGKVFLFVSKEGSVGFFDPEKNAAFSIFSGKDSHYHVTTFLKRIIHETDIFRNAPEGSIWLPPTNLN